MIDKDKSKEQLILELVELRKQNADITDKFQLNINKIKELEIEKEKYRNIFENTIVGIYQSSPEGQYILANPAFAYILGYESSEELLSSIEAPQLYVNKEDRAKCIHEVLKHGVGSFEVQVYRKDGSKVWISNYVRVVRDKGGNVICFEGMVGDINQRKQVEDEINEYSHKLEEIINQRTLELQTTLAQLRQEIVERELAKKVLYSSQERFRKAFYASPCMMVISKLSDNIMIEVNDSFVRSVGYSREEIVGRTASDLNLWANTEQRDKTISLLQEQHSVRDMEVAFNTKSGELREALLSAELIEINGEKCLLVAGIDITERKRFEKELRDSEEKYRNLFHNANDAIYLYELKDDGILGTFIEVNDVACQRMGYTKDEFLGVTPKDIYPKEQADKLYGFIQNILTQNHLTCEMIHISKNGLKIPVEISSHFYNLEDKKVILTIARDITERKQAEEVLLNQFRQMSTIFDSINALVYVTDMENYELLFVNKYGLDLFGTSIIGRPCYEVLQVNQSEPCPYCTNHLLVYETTQPSHIWEFKNTILNRWFQCIDRAIPWVDGRLVRMEIAFDITGLKKTEDELRLSKERFSKAFNATPALMTISTIADGRYISVNDTFLNITGFRSEEVIGHKVVELNLISEARDQMISVLKKQGKVCNWEIKFRLKSGETRIGLFSADFIELDGEQCLLIVVNDISKYKQLEVELSRLSRLNLIGEMAAGIAHEIRNPMTTVRGLLQILGQKERYHQDKEYFNLMIQELDRANLIITEFLSLAKNRNVDFKTQNLNHILDSLFPLIKADAMVSGKYVALDQNEVPNLLLDEKEIRQLVLNLTRNGLEALLSGGCLTIKTYLDDGKVVLSVHDQGKGIPDEILEKIGTPFFTTKDNGTGLGLATCYSIAAKHNASISFDTGPDGTTFYVRFKG